jgi:hypothetical protein
LAPTAERISKTRRTRSEAITINCQTVVEEPFGTVESISSGTYGVTRKAFVGGLAPTTKAGRLANTIIASSEEDTGILGIRGHEEGREEGQKEKSSRREHPCVWFFFRGENGRRSERWGRLGEERR